MVTEAIKKVRDIFAYGLLAVAVLYLISALSLLFKSEDDVGLDFSGKAAVFSHLFAHPVLVFALLAAVALAVGFGGASKNARTVVLVALGIAGVALLLRLICWFSGFGADDSSFANEAFGGVLGAGKVVGSLLGLAELLLLGLAAWFAYTALQSLPKAAASTASSWGQPQGYGGQQGYGQQPWGQQVSGYPGQASWGQQGQGWGTGAGGGATATGTPAAGWGDQSHAQAEQQGQPASAWTGADQGYSGREQGGYAPPTDPQQVAWGQPGQPGQPGQSWGQAEAHQSWGTAAPPTAHPGAAPTGPPQSEPTHGGPAQTEQRDSSSRESREQSSGPEEEQRQGWWQRPSQ